MCFERLCIKQHSELMCDTNIYTHIYTDIEIDIYIDMWFPHLLILQRFHN